MDGSLFVLLLLSGLFWSSSALSRQYHYINVRMSWPEAQSYCREKYTDLATVDTMADVNRLVNIVDAGYSGSVWIGLKRGTQKRLAWSNGENISSPYSNWAPGEPNENTYCVSFFLASGLIRDVVIADILHATRVKNKEYIMVKITKNWTDAQSYCRQYYTDLPTIHNSEENKQINKIIPSTSWVWIGLFLDSWEWSDKWSHFFRNWAADQPSQSSGSDDCVGISTTNSGKWPQYSCDLHQPFICYGGEFPHIYHYINARMSWPEAQSYCREKYTDLATVDTMADVNRLVNIVDAGYSGSVWIGLKRGTENRWAWSNGENTLTQYKYEYIRVQIWKNWSDAQSYCRQYHTDLPTIHNSEEENKIKSILPSTSWVWIGLFLDSWEWSDKWSLFFRNWAAGQPSDSSGSGDCVGMLTTDSGKWAQYSCDLKQPFICYGDEKKKQIVRLKLSCNGECTLNDPSLQTAILNEISEKLKSMGLESDSKISWKKGEGEEVFHQDLNHLVDSNKTCNVHAAAGAEDSPLPTPASEQLMEVLSRAVARLNINWPQEHNEQASVKSRLDERFLPVCSVQPPWQSLPVFIDHRTEVSKSWKRPVSSCIFSSHTVQLRCLVGKVYSAAGQAPACLHTMSIVQSYHADLLKDPRESHEIGAIMINELRSTAELALQATK
ncbi:macrophage mannose receptor 1-like [Pseudorasbora parva]|uniref:macrophage mannose receptor 1-like n=1 Tax=Pseudorasbora parva TaxID=51549 RepID=UPI00351EFDC8